MTPNNEITRDFSYLLSSFVIFLHSLSAMFFSLAVTVAIFLMRLFKLFIKFFFHVTHIHKKCVSQFYYNLQKGQTGELDFLN